MHNGVFREVDMEWQGETYTFVPSNKLLRRIEGQDISLADMISRVGTAKPPMSEIAFVSAEFLKAGGAEVTEDEVYAEIMLDMAENDGKGFIALCESIIMAISPAEPAGKKPAAPASKSPRKKSGAKSKK